MIDQVRVARLTRVREALAKIQWVKDAARVCPGVSWEDVGQDTRERYLCEQKLAAILVVDAYEADVPIDPFVFDSGGIDALALKLARDECGDDLNWEVQKEWWKADFRERAKEHVRSYVKGSGGRVE